MDTLLLCLLACMWGEMGDRSQALTHILARRHQRRYWVIAGLAVAAAVNAALSACAGGFIATSIGAGARNLFLALALLAAAVTMMMPTKAPDMLSTWRLGAFGNSAIGLFILGFGESAQFLIAGFAAAHAEPFWAGAGGAAGVILACSLALVMEERWARPQAWRWIRRAGGVLFLVSGFILAVGALGVG